MDTDGPFPKKWLGSFTSCDGTNYGRPCLESYPLYERVCEILMNPAQSFNYTSGIDGKGPRLSCTGYE